MYMYMYMYMSTSMHMSLSMSMYMYGYVHMYIGRRTHHLSFGNIFEVYDSVAMLGIGDHNVITAVGSPKGVSNKRPRKKYIGIMIISGNVPTQPFGFELPVLGFRFIPYCLGALWGSLKKGDPGLQFCATHSALSFEAPLLWTHFS